MTVADLQQYFRELAKLMYAANGVKASAELSKVADSLAPFGEESVEHFASFLLQAHEYARTGIIPVKPGKTVKPPKTPAPPKADVAALGAEVKHLYATAGSAGVALDSIEAIRPKLAKLRKAELQSVAHELNLTIPSKLKIEDAVNLIVNTIKSIKQNAIRVSASDRQGVSH